MRARALSAAFVAACVLLSSTVPAQEAKKPEKKPKQTGEPKPHEIPLFASESPLAVTFTANLRQLRGDKGEKAPWRAATLTYAADGKTTTVPVKARTRGIWRLKNCEFPPVRLDAKSADAKGTILQGFGQPKLVSYCRDNDEYEQYVLQEFQLYRVYRLLTPASHRVRLLRMTYADSGSGKPVTTRWAFLSEDPEQMAERFGGVMLKTEGAGPGDFEPRQHAMAYLFLYMIGNTDFSFNRLHNGELLSTNTADIYPVPYDFDWTGAVNPRYATPDPKLNQRSMRERHFRGYCPMMGEYVKLFPYFLEKKPAIYALYSDEIGKLMNPGTVKETLAYFDEFFDMIKDPKDGERTLSSQCTRA